jgi:hypothetical protein
MIAALVACVCAAATSAAAEPQVTVRGRPLPLAPLVAAADVQERRYTLRTASGRTSERVVTGVSLAAVLRAAGADVDPFRYAEVQDPSGASVLVSRDQALDADPAGDGPPVFWLSAEGARFLRPSAGRDDPNAGDELVGGELVVRLREQIRLGVSVRASKTRPEPNEAVTFRAEVSGAGAGETVELSWWFDDRRSATGPTVRHRFEKPGAYHVVVGATTASDPAGAADTVTITVGDEARTSADSSGGSDESSTSSNESSSGGNVSSSAGSNESSARARERSKRSSLPPVGREPRAKSSRERADQGGAVVAGELLNATVPPPATARPVVVPRAVGSSAAAGLRLPPEAWVGIGALAVLALGSGVELRRSRVVAR